MKPELQQTILLLCTLAQDDFPGLTPDRLIKLISVATRPVVAEQPSMELMTVPAVAAALRITTRSVYTLIATKQIPKIKIGRATRLSRHAVESFIQSRQQGGDLSASAPPQVQSKRAKEVPPHRS
ncbi:MAG: Helix-turn-helix domain [Verrucomicrobiota bacterium]